MGQSHDVESQLTFANRRFMVTGGRVRCGVDIRAGFLLYCDDIRREVY